MVGGHDAIVEHPAGAPYQGRVGQTRIETFELPEGHGPQSSCPLHRVVNVETDPELKARALAGKLHALPDGQVLALPFVYHDPDNRHFVLVVPAALAHMAFEESAKLMLDVARDRSAPVPTYVREAQTVIGVEELQRVLDDGDEVEGDELHDAPEASHLPDTQWHEHSDRTVAVPAPTAPKAPTAPPALPTASPRVSGGGWHEVQEEAPLREDRTVITTLSETMARANQLRANREVSEASEVSEEELRQAPPPLRPRPPTGPPPLPSMVDDLELGVAPPPLPSMVADDEVSSNVAPPPLPAAPPVPDDLGVPRSPEVAPPQAFFQHARGRMAMVSDADGLWLYAEVSADECEAYRRAADLLTQCVERVGHPVVLLTLVAGDDGAPYAVRLPLDGREPTDLAVLEGLAQSYRARVALYVGGSYVDTITIATLREEVARAVLEHIERLPEVDAIASPEAIAEVLASPPPIDDPDLPFGPSRRQASSASTVLAAVEQLASWLRPEKLEEAMLVYSVPTHVVEGSARRVLRSAKLFGVALPPELVAAAIDYGVVADHADLVRQQIEGFQRRLDAGDHLGAEGTTANWELLRVQAAETGVDFPGDSAGVDGGDGGGEEPSPLGDSEPPMRSSADLKADLQDPDACMQAIAELAQRGHPGLIEPIFDVLESLSPAQVATGTAALLGFGEAATDYLQAGLDSPNLHLRHVCALALGQQRLRRSIAPLLQALDREPTNIWVEMARAMGDFGTAGLRSVVRAVPSADKPERLMLVMAHLANHGAAKDVETLENDSNSQVAAAARKAMARRSRLEWEDLAVRQQRTLTDASPATRFSQSFYAELPKVDN